MGTLRDGSIETTSARRQPALYNRAALRTRLIAAPRRQSVRGRHLLSDHLGLIRWLIARLEGFENDSRLTEHIALASLGIDRHEFDPLWHPERRCRCIAECHPHEVGDYRRCKLAAGAAPTHGLWIVVADENAYAQVGRVSDEPGVALFIGGPGLASHRLADRQELAPGAALNHSF